MAKKRRRKNPSKGHSGMIDIGTVWGHGVELYTIVEGVPANRIDTFIRLLQEMMPQGSEYEMINLDGWQVKEMWNGKLAIKLDWFTGGEMLIHAGEGQMAVQDVLKRMKLKVGWVWYPEKAKKLYKKFAKNPREIEDPKKLREYFFSLMDVVESTTGEISDNIDHYTRSLEFNPFVVMMNGDPWITVPVTIWNAYKVGSASALARIQLAELMKKRKELKIYGENAEIPYVQKLDFAKKALKRLEQNQFHLVQIVEQYPDVIDKAGEPWVIVPEFIYKTAAGALSVIILIITELKGKYPMEVGS